MANLKRAALFHLQARSGAVFTNFHGWEMPEKFTSVNMEVARVRSGVGLADLSYRTKFEKPLQNFEPLMDSQPPSLHHRYGSPFFAPSAAVDVTGAYTNLLLLGPHSRRVLGFLTSLDISETALPNFACTETKMAHVHAAILREDVNQLLGFHLLIPREYSESAWTSILYAGDEFGIRPVGLRALELLRLL